MPDLFSLYDLASYLQSDLDTATAERARRRATNYFRTELGVEFDDPIARTLATRVAASRTYVQLLGPLVSVQSVTVDGTVLTVDVDYEVTKRGIACPNGFGQRAATDWVDLAVAYTAGFAVVPAELADWGMHLAGIAYQRGAQAGAEATAVAADGVSESIKYPGGGDVADSDPVVLPERVMRGLRYRYGSDRPRAGTVRIR